MREPGPGPELVLEHALVVLEQPALGLVLEQLVVAVGFEQVVVPIIAGFGVN